jgi:SAM-dependent methyltransferase
VTDQPGSISFDRAADYYDRTRALPEAVARRQTELLLGALGDSRDPVLEIGVGTGRIALPLARRGVPMVGLDLSPKMLARLHRNADGDRFPLVLGDATQLPFADASFGACIASHVFHLIPHWKQALDEAHRVLNRGGVLLQTRGSPSHAGREVTRRFLDLAGSPSWPPGAASNAVVDRAAAAIGFEVGGLDELRFEEQVDLGEEVDRLEKGIYSACWSLSEERRRAAATATRRWLLRRYGSPHPRVDATQVLAWRAYTRP